MDNSKLRTLDDMLQPGQKVKVFYNKGNINNTIWHIRAIVDEDCIVFRTWKSGSWSYRINSRYKFEYMYEKGRLS